MSPAADLPAVQGRSQTDVVIDGIKDMITTGSLRAGSRLPIEKDLAAQLGVSRGSLREGVRALASLGVLETRQGDGTYVTALDPRALLSPLGFFAELQTPANSADLLAVRRVLEEESVSLAVSRLTEDDLVELDRVLSHVDEIMQQTPDLDLEEFIDADAAFHRIIARASGNSALAGLIETLVSRTFRTRLWRAMTDVESVREAHGEHRAILDELRKRNQAGARIRMSVHLLGVEEYSKAHPSAGSSSATPGEDGSE